MFGWIVYAKTRPKAEWIQVRGIPCYRVSVAGERHLRKAVRLLQQAGVRRVLLPATWQEREAWQQLGFSLVGESALRQSLATELCRQILWDEGGERVSLWGKRLTPALRQTAEKLCSEVRYLVLHLERGQEELGLDLQRRFGIAVQYGGTAELALLFDPMETQERSLRLYDGGEWEQPIAWQLPKDLPQMAETAGGAWLAMLWQEGKISRRELLSALPRDWWEHIERNGTAGNLSA